MCRASLHPSLVAGRGHPCTTLLERLGDRVLVKMGAEGVYGATCPARGLGMAVKVADGARRASGVALIQVLELTGLLSPDDATALESFRRAPIRHTLDEVVGWVEADFGLEWAG